MKLIYVAGPYRGPGDWAVKQNIQDAEKFARELWRRGFAVICPHANSAFMGGSEIPDDVFLKGDLEILRRCDAIFMIPGWERSAGARAEYQFSLDNNIPIFFGVPAAAEWLYARGASA